MSRKSKHYSSGLVRGPLPPRDHKAWADGAARQMGTYLRELREDAGLSQSALAKKLEVHNSWVSRMEGGTSPLRSDDDIETVALAIGADPKDALSFWHSILDENVGVSPWEHCVVFPESFRRQGELREHARKASRAWKKTELAPGVTFDVLAELVRTNEVARAAIAAMCDAHTRQ